jgi:glycosyltransferase involved in cell wall biosynthesis
MGANGQSPRVSVVVPARNASATLGRTLESLKRQQLDAAYEVIVVDDGSSDGTFELASRPGPPVTVVRNDDTRGPGAARNEGVRAARAPVIAFTDADCFPAPDWLSRGLRAIEGADLVQGAVEPDPSVSRSRFDRTIVVNGEHGYYETANMFVRRELFESLGGFEDWIVERGGEGLFGWRAPQDGRRAEPARRNFGEDTLFGWCARRAGARTLFAPEALVHHAVFPETKLGWVLYQWRWKRHMPGLARRVPELREEFFFHRWFLERRSAEFDLAVAATLVALLTRRRAPLIGALPYARRVYEGSARRGIRPGIVFATTSIAADAVSLASLLVGSAAWRAPVF